MNDQQAFGLIAVCALLMIPLGVLLGGICRVLRARLSVWLPPRYLKRAGVRQRRSDRGGHA